MAEQLERQVQPRLNLLAVFVLSSPEFNSLVILVNSQLVFLWPVGILTVDMFILKCLFLSLFVGHSKNYLVQFYLFYSILFTSFYNLLSCCGSV